MNSVAKSLGTGERIRLYDISDAQMAAGSTLGAPKIVVIVKATGAIEKIYSSDAGETMIGTIVVHHWDEQTGISLRPLPGSFYIHPDHQGHIFELTNGVEVSERIFVLNSEPVGDELDPPAAYYWIRLRNKGEERVSMDTYAFAQLKGSLGPDLEVSYDRKRNAFVVVNAPNRSLVRVLGSVSKPLSYEVGHDHGKATAEISPGRLSGETTASGADPLGTFHFSNSLSPGEEVELGLKIAFSVKNADEALAYYDAAPDPKTAWDQTSSYFSEILDRAVLITPDAEVNRGVLWAKANMLRVLLHASTGWCFVNDPTRSNNSVARDTSWFALGADFVLPEFARESLLWYADHLEPSGMVVEYYDVRTGEPADYRLNINDDTPLLIMALWHHYSATGDREFLDHVYPSALKAARYMLSQRDERGLVWCTADGTADWGIVGWRNVIEGYRMSGATTELNSECYAALRTISLMARVMGEESEALEFSEHARALREAINKHLFDPKRKLYYLNIDIDGTIRTDMTGDLVFPVMFGVAEDDVAAHIISRLSVDEFWTEAGIRTVPRTSATYGPTHGYGLLGGVWVNVTFWFAMAAARFNPEFMAYALSTSFKYYSQDPRRNNTVPGQFSEWLHGETLANQGMMLSPWFAPHYLWAAIEGAAGLTLAGDEPLVMPQLPSAWKWLGVRNLLFRGKKISWFVARQPDLRMYSTFKFEKSLDGPIFDEDCSNLVELTGEAAAAMALHSRDHIAILVGNTTERTITTALRLAELPRGEYRLSSFNSLRGKWREETVSAEQLALGLPLELAGYGFCVLEMQGSS